MKQLLDRVGLLWPAVEGNSLAHRLCFGVVGRRRITRYLAGTPEPKLHMGCGGHTLDGWLNTDLSPRPLSGALYMDVRKSFPVKSQSFQYAFSEHLIEHLGYEAGLGMLRECHRVLRPGGVLRIVTPDLRFLGSIYSAPEDTSERYVQWASDTFKRDGAPRGRAFVINNFFYSWGHRFIYDEEALRCALELAGFKRIEVGTVGESEHDALRGIDNELRMPAGFLAFESIVVEGVKDGAEEDASRICGP